MPWKSGSFAEPRALRLQGPLVGRLRPPGSKSLAQRALLASAMAQGRSELHGLPEGDDVRACLEVVHRLGAQVVPGATCLVDGRAGCVAPGISSIAAGESATLARLSTALLGFHGPPGVLRVDALGSLCQRHSPALFASLRASGVQLEPTSRGQGDWPLELRSAPLPSRLELTNPSSSQEVSALWMASAVSRGPREVWVHGQIPSRPYLDLTEQVLGWFGVALQHEEVEPHKLRTRLEGPLVSPGAIFIEPDASSAAVALAAACLSDGELSIPGLGQQSKQGDVAMVEFLKAFGCRAGCDPDELWASGLPERAASLNLEAHPDLAPPLAIIAAAAAQRSGESCELHGLAGLKGKESDRLAVLAEGLGAAGWPVEVGGESLLIGAPRSRSPKDLVLDPHGDHRMAFAFALLGILRPGILVKTPGCVAKSWPGFWTELER